MGKINKKELDEDIPFITLFSVYCIFMYVGFFFFYNKGFNLFYFSIVTLFHVNNNLSSEFPLKLLGIFKVYSNANIFKTIINISTIFICNIYF